MNTAKEFYYLYKDTAYLVKVTYKKSHRISLRMHGNDLIVYAPYFTKDDDIKKVIDKFNKKLFIENPMITSKGDDYIYLLGNKISLINHRIDFTDGTSITFKDDEQLNKKLKKWFLALIEQRTRYYENIMGTVHHKVTVRKMTSRYGSNSIEKHIIHYSTILMHYTIDVIDSVVIHELAHDFVKGHDNNFYKIVLKYCPSYRQIHLKLKKGIFNDQNN